LIASQVQSAAEIRYINLLLTATACNDKSHVALGLRVQLNVHVRVLVNIVHDSENSYNTATFFRAYICYIIV